MAQNSQNSESQSNSDEESREQYDKREKDIESDIKLMETLF